MHDAFMYIYVALNFIGVISIYKYTISPKSRFKYGAKSIRKDNFDSVIVLLLFSPLSCLK